MKHLLHLAPMLLLLAACQSNPTTPESGEAAPDVTKRQAKQEYIILSMLTVNGEPHEEITVKVLERQLGRPDSIATGAVECGSELEAVSNESNGDFWYYGKTMYEVSGSKAILTSFNVTSGKFLGRLGDLVLNQNTTLENVRRFFPVVVQDAERTIGHSGQMIQLPIFHDGAPTDSSLLLYFVKGHLQAVEFFSPC